MAVSKASDEVRLNNIPLKVVRDPESGTLQYQDTKVVGKEVIDPAAAEQFVDVFTSWHKGGFVAEYVQDGFYNEAENVDCTKPGEIKPGPRRLATLDAAKDNDKNHMGVRGLAYDGEFDRLLVVVGSGNDSNDVSPKRIYTRWVANDHTFDAGGVNLTTHSADYDGLTSGFTSKATPLTLPIALGRFDYFIPVGDAYVHVTNADGIIATVAVPCHELLVLGGRIFKTSIKSTGEVGFSNMDRAGDKDAAASWTTPVDMDVFEAQPVGLGLGALNDVPFIVTSQGVFLLAPGGAPYNAAPRYAKNPLGIYALYPVTPVGSGDAVGVLSGGHILWFREGGSAEVGPAVNPVAEVPTGRVMHMEESPSGDLWVLYWRSEVSNSDGVWELWRGVRQPGTGNPPGYAWHPILRDINAGEGGPDNDITTGAYSWRKHRLMRPFLPFWFYLSGSPRPELAIATGHSPEGDTGTNSGATDTTLVDSTKSWTTNEWVGFTVTCNSKTMVVTSNDGTTLTGASWSGGGNPGSPHAYEITKGVARVTFVHGGLFFQEQDYEHEDDAIAGYTVTVKFRSGRYSRHDRRTKRHWTALHFLGKNISAGSGALGGRVKVEVSFDGGAFVNPPAGATYLTGNDQTVPLNTTARDIEYRLTWQLDGKTGTASDAMRNAPATVTEVQFEGLEEPRALRRLSLIVRGDTPPQAGGVRRKDKPDTMFTALTGLVGSGKVTFTDPYNADRTVVVLPGQRLSAEEAKGLKVPEGAIALELLEVPS